MPTVYLRRMVGAPRGQALPMACLLLLLISIAVLTTVHVGHTVHERIRLQNDADAAAFSMAAMEARAFNFYAFANRTQATHYVSAMMFQSVDSFLYFNEAFLTDTYGVMLTLNPCSGSRDAFWATACPLLEAVPALGALMKFFDSIILIFERLVQTYQAVLRSSSADELIGRGIIPGLRTLSAGLGELSTESMQSALAEVQSTAEEILKANDPNLDSSRSRALTGGLSACLFDRAHYRESNGSPLRPNDHPSIPLKPGERAEKSKVARAKRVMAQVANGTRYGCDGDSRCPEKFVTSRKLGDLVLLPAWLGPLKEFLSLMPKWGQTRLLTFNLAKGYVDRDQGGNYLRDPDDTPDHPMAMLAQGDNLGADDLYEMKLGEKLGPLADVFACDSNTERYWECWGEPRRNHLNRDGERPYRFMMKTSVWATNSDEGPQLGPGGVHWRVAFPDYPRGRGHRPPNAPNEIERQMGLNRFQRYALGLPISVYVANVRPIQDGNHPWPGMLPFSHFEPGQFSEDCSTAGTRGIDPLTTAAATRMADFNQPSTWVLLNKKPEAMSQPVADATGAGTNFPALLGGRLGLRFQASSTGLNLEDRRQALSLGGFGPGLNVLARAQAYYHRPGNWAEQPNFFNPYWRPRLASVYQGREGNPLVRDLIEQLPPDLRRTPQKAVTH